MNESTKPTTKQQILPCGAIARRASRIHLQRSLPLVLGMGACACGDMAAGTELSQTVVQQPLSTVRPEVAALWDTEVIVDGLQEPLYGVDSDGDGAWDLADPTKPADESNATYRSATGDYSEISTDTGVNVMSGKIAGTCAIDDPGDGTCVAPDGGFSTQVSRYNAKVADGVHFVKTAADLSCRHTYDALPDFVIYQQKLWGIDFPDGASDEARRTQTEQVAEQFLANGLRILQLEYSQSENQTLYQPGEQFAGQHSEATDPGITVQGDALARYALEHGAILDVSHSRNATVDDTLALAAEYASRRNRAVPVLANHADIDDPSWKPSERNKSFDEMCRIAASGGTVGVMPVKNFLPDGATFLTVADEIDAIRNYSCPMLDWKGEPIDMIDHISVASDSAVNHYADYSQFFVDSDAARTDHWRWLASQMLDSGDFDIDDLRRIFGANHLRALRAGLEGQLPFEPELCAFPTGNVFTGDFDGDGRDDLLYQGADGGTWIDYARRGGEFTGIDWKRSDSPTADQSWCSINQDRELHVGDFNGDGRDDLLCQQSDGRTWIDYADTDGRFFGTNWSRDEDAIDKNWCYISSTRELHIGDFNGDGRDDLLCQQSDGRTWIDYANTSGGFNGTNWSRDADSVDKNWCYISSTRELHIGDFNGDGRDDLLCHQSDGKSWIDYANTSGGFNGTNWSRSQEPDPEWCLVGPTLTLAVADADGDGRDDLVCHSRSSGTLFLDRASASGTFSGTDWNSDGGFCMASTQTLHTGDVNDDGAVDLLCYEADDGWLTMSMAENDVYVYELEQTQSPQSSTGQIAGNFSVQTDWGGGYCVELQIVNTQPASTTTWAASFALNGTNIYDIWNLDLTIDGGSASVTPIGAWASEIGPGQTSYSLGFCATRPNGGNALPGAPSVTAQF